MAAWESAGFAPGAGFVAPAAGFVAAPGAAPWADGLAGAEGP
jgi:hypothetical protein